LRLKSFMVLLATEREWVHAILRIARPRYYFAAGEWGQCRSGCRFSRGEAFATEARKAQGFLTYLKQGLIPCYSKDYV
jgi:hypothetical protein